MFHSDKKFILQNKSVILDILCESFDQNTSVNFVVKQDDKRKQRLRILMAYSFYKGLKSGEIYLNESKTACVILIDPAKKKTNLKSIFWDLKLMFKCIGLGNVKNVLKHEKLIKEGHPKVDFMHLWYIGVKTSSQGQGLGSELLHQLIVKTKKPLFLETSTQRNFPFYEKHGFKTVEIIDSLGYELRMYMKGRF